jgi:hypothetical protein
MAKTFNLTLDLPQPAIKVAVEFYDDAEKQKLLKYPTHAAMENLVENGVQVPTEEFLTYYLFHKKRPGKEGWRNYAEVGRKIGNALAELSDWVDFNGESVSTPSDVFGQDKAITERIGESIGLSVISRIHGLTAADWDRIPIRRYSTFDFEIASDGQHVIQMEAKGSAVKHNSAKTSAISHHKGNIADKKKEIAEREKQNDYPYPADLRYGTITIMGESALDPVKCLLVDPPAEGGHTAAEKLRVLQRMRFLRDWISFISPRSQLASALQTRLSALERLPDPFLLDGVPLVKGNGKHFDFPPIGGMLGGHSAFFATKSRIADGPAGGVSVPLPNGNLFFLGIRETILERAAHQELRRLFDFKTEQGPLRKRVECVVTEKTLSELRLPRRIIERAFRYGPYYTFELAGDIHYSDTGILFGVLPTDEQHQ